MIIRVYDGEIDASKLSVVTPVIIVDKDETGNAIADPYYVIQITCDGTRTTLRYETKEQADRERNFIISCWLDSKDQKDGIMIMPSLDPKRTAPKKKGEANEGDKSGDKESKKD